MAEVEAWSKVVSVSFVIIAPFQLVRIDWSAIVQFTCGHFIVAFSCDCALGPFCPSTRRWTCVWCRLIALTVFSVVFVRVALDCFCAVLFVCCDACRFFDFVLVAVLCAIVLGNLDLIVFICRCRIAVSFIDGCSIRSEWLLCRNGGLLSVGRSRR
jgi:hypothetical protein